MKIEFNPKSIVPSNAQPPKTDSNPIQKTFGQVMTETMTTNSLSNGKKKVSTPGTLMSPLSLDLMEKNINEPNLVSKIEHFLDYLGQYQTSLKNPRVSLRQMEPLIQKMTAKLKDLETELEKLDPQDPLTSILKETLITASLEIKKYENGWYNPI
ncbi:MAG: hypothetical protein PVI90_11465 [Desulfobacteraceae bacterium]|jgi:hypothetical protein